MHEIVFDPKAIEFLEKTEKLLAKRIWNKIQSTKENPHRFFERLEGRTDYNITYRRLQSYSRYQCFG